MILLCYMLCYKSCSIFLNYKVYKGGRKRVTLIIYISILIHSKPITLFLLYSILLYSSYCIFLRIEHQFLKKKEDVERNILFTFRHLDIHVQWLHQLFLNVKNCCSSSMYVCVLYKLQTVFSIIFHNFFRYIRQTFCQIFSINNRCT